MCDIIIKEFNYDIETKYIYGSRQAWRLPCVDCIEDLVSAFKTNGYIGTFKTIAEMLDISTDELMNFYKANHSITKMIGDHEAVAIYNTLAQNPKFMEYILKTMDIESCPLGNFATVSLQAMQFILYTNPKKIYLVGIDCNGFI